MAHANADVRYGPCNIVMGYRALGRLLPKGSGRLLELGARQAANRRAAEANGFEYVSIDIDFYPQISAVGDAHAVPFKDETFDVVMLPCVLEHFRDPRVALAECLRITKTGGMVIGQVSFLEPYHHSYFHHSHIAVIDALRVAGYTNITIDTGANAFVLIYARVLAMVFNVHSRKVIVRLSRMLFPINLLLDLRYAMGWVKNALRGRDLAEYKRKHQEFRKDLALRIAGHIIFTATRA